MTAGASFYKVFTDGSTLQGESPCSPRFDTCGSR